MHDDFAQLKEQLAVPAMTANERDALWAHIDLSEQLPAASRSRRHVQRSTRTLLVAIVALVAVSGVAIAAGNGVLDGLLPDSTPAPARVHAFVEPPTQPVTPAEYKQLTSLTMVPPPGQGVGTFPNSDLVAKYHLEPIEKARVLVDDPRVGRLVAVPTADGATLCELYMSPGGAHNGDGSGGCGGQFDTAGLMTEFMFGKKSGGLETFEMYGIAADDVNRIEVVFADGTTRNVTLINSAFRWKGTGETERPVRIRSLRDEKWYASGDANLFAKAHDPYLAHVRSRR